MSEKKRIPVNLTKKDLEGIYDSICNHSGITTENIFDLKARIGLAIGLFNAPEFGERCVFWNDDPSFYTVGKLVETQTETGSNVSKYTCDYEIYFKNCAKLEKDAEFKRG